MTTRGRDLVDRLRAGFPGPAPEAVGVAVSGGGDSMALLALMRDWRQAGGPALCAVTVDHGLRAEAAREAAAVARQCAAWEIPHDTLRWQDREGRGNLADRARRARYRLIAEWAQARGLACVALGHTRDDLAETFLMRLARRAGVDGLAAMAARRRLCGVEFRRPLLWAGREELRDLLRGRGVAWAEDPSNEDEASERVRARRALAALAPLGIDPQALAAVAGNLGDVRDCLAALVAQAARALARIEGGDVVIEREGLAALEPEIARRLLQEALIWISGAEYPPRGAAMARLVARLARGESQTLHGCRITTRARSLRIAREERAVAGLRVPAGEIWDRRWRLTGPEMAGAEVAALSARGLALLPEPAGTALPKPSLRASPAVWRGDMLLAAPLAGFANGWRAELVRRDEHDFAALLSH